MRVVSFEQEFQQARQRALAALADPQALEPRAALVGYRPELRLWDYPSLEQCRSWTVFLPLPVQVSEGGVAYADAEALPLVREATWDRRRDVWRLSDPREQLNHRLGFEPTLRVCDGTLPRRAWERRVAALEGLALPLEAAKPAGGPYAEFFGTESGVSFKGARVQWWCDDPAEWEELAEWFADLRRFLIGCVDPI